VVIDLEGKVAVVTGAARGLGLLLARRLAAEGMHVVGVDTRGDLLQREMGAIQAPGGARTMAAVLDIGDEAAVADMVRGTVAQFGRIDVLVNNAGVRQLAPIWKTDTAMWDRVHDSNLKGHFLCTREVLSQDMLQRGEGTLIFVSSGSGKKGEEDSSAYCSSKWGVIGFAESVAKDLKKTRIRVSVITPGKVETPMAHESPTWNPNSGWLNPVDVADAILYCIKQDPDMIIPEFRTYHRSQI
jgi:3-oxoacyl-[acyl-carrier protein] reductase